MDEQQHQDGRKNASHHDVGADPDSSHAHIESGADADEVSGMPHSVVVGACRSGDEQEGSSETVDDAQDSELDELEVNDDSDGTDGSECSSSSSSSSTTNSSSSASVSASASATASLQSTNAATAVVKCTESSAVVVGEGSTSVASTTLESSDGKKKKNRKNRKRNKKKKKKKNSKVQSSQTHSDTKHEETSSTDDSHSVSPSSPLSPSASSASTLKTNSSAVTLVLPASVPPSSSSSSSIPRSSKSANNLFQMSKSTTTSAGTSAASGSKSSRRHRHQVLATQSATTTSSTPTSTPSTTRVKRSSRSRTSGTESDGGRTQQSPSVSRQRSISSALPTLSPPDRHSESGVRSSVSSTSPLGALSGSEPMSDEPTGGKIKKEDRRKIIDDVFASWAGVDDSNTSVSSSLQDDLTSTAQSPKLRVHKQRQLVQELSEQRADVETAVSLLDRINELLENDRVKHQLEFTECTARLRSNRSHLTAAMDEEKALRELLATAGNKKLIQVMTLTDPVPPVAFTAQAKTTATSSSAATSTSTSTVVNQATPSSDRLRSASFDSDRKQGGLPEKKSTGRTHVRIPASADLGRASSSVKPAPPSGQAEDSIFNLLSLIQNAEMLHDIIIRLASTDASLTPLLTDLVHTALLDPASRRSRRRKSTKREGSEPLELNVDSTNIRLADGRVLRRTKSGKIATITKQLYGQEDL